MVQVPPIPTKGWYTILRKTFSKQIGGYSLYDPLIDDFSNEHETQLTQIT